MKKLYTTILTAILMVNVAYANEDHKHAEGYSEVESNAEQMYSGDVNVHVTGLVCDFCARALEKVFGKEASVQNIEVDLDEGLVRVYFKEGGSMAHDKLISLIVDSGYNVEGIEAHES